ncbi:hypothetical protein ASD8599_04062 [Ascidiaceihabitans donghaensis]|uniref:Uncharacterized protein n=1 Tax=Ascidiaceihabitans donghaensis TaxID=1510460 RepID=A0A2R8BPU6_9RHOB|nr:hypothetical protein ASD8599_04062 [Ascidiaceihabitans donghaensis]
MGVGVDVHNFLQMRQPDGFDVCGQEKQVDLAGLVRAAEHRLQHSRRVGQIGAVGGKSHVHMRRPVQAVIGDIGRDQSLRQIDDRHLMHAQIGLGGLQVMHINRHQAFSHKPQIPALLNAVMRTVQIKGFQLGQNVEDPRGIAFHQVTAHDKHIAQTDVFIGADRVKAGQIFGVVSSDDVAGQVEVFGGVALAIVFFHGPAHAVHTRDDQIIVGAMGGQPVFGTLQPVGHVETGHIQLGFVTFKLAFEIQHTAIVHQPDMAGGGVVFPRPIQRRQFTIKRIAA